jgi:hypothetical protein
MEAWKSNRSQGCTGFQTSGHSKPPGNRCARTMQQHLPCPGRGSYFTHDGHLSFAKYESMLVTTRASDTTAHRALNTKRNVVIECMWIVIACMQTISRVDTTRMLQVCLYSQHVSWAVPAAFGGPELPLRLLGACGRSLGGHEHAELPHAGVELA